LVEVGATSKAIRKAVQDEVECRKKEIATAEQQILMLIGVAGNEPAFYTRGDVLAAQEVKDEAWKLVAGMDEGVQLNLELPTTVHHPFHAELLKFELPEPVRDANNNFVLQPRSPLAVLPMVFYLPLEGEPEELTEQDIDRYEAAHTGLRNFFLTFQRMLNGDVEGVFKNVVMRAYLGHEGVLFSRATRIPPLVYLKAVRAAARETAFHNKTALPQLRSILGRAEVATNSGDNFFSYGLPGWYHHFAFQADSFGV
jgi:hypothetical protein